MKNLLNWFNGKKTIFGLVLLELSHSTALQAYPLALEIVTIAGGVLTGYGVLHKMVKPSAE